MPSPVQLSAGQIFASDFRVVRPLSSGGMGSVYVVHQLSTGAERALKLMHPELVADPKQRARFEQEARVGARIDSDHVVNVIVAGIDPASGLPFIVMELLEGTELGKMLHQRGILPRGEVVVILSQLSHALAAAHAVGVVHRDLKPENVFIATSRRADIPLTVKILDFGIAKVVAELKNSATQSVGTPLFMAPEQGDARAQISPATDVWSFALMAFQMLTGKCFWLGAADGGSVEQIMAEVLVYDVPLASARAAELGVAHHLPPGIEPWFKRATERDPRLRFQDAGEAWRALSPVLVAGIAATNTPGVVGGAYAPTIGGQTGTPQGYAPVGGRSPTPPGHATGPQGYGAAPAQGYATGPQGYGAVPAQGYATGPAYAQTGYGPPPQAGGYTQAPAGYAVPPAGFGPNAIPAQPPRKKNAALVPALAAAGVLALAGASVGGYFLFRKKPTPPAEKSDKITYCDNLVDRYHVPVCGAEVSDTQRKHRDATFKIIEREGKVVEVDLLNALDHPVAFEDEVATRTFEYDGDALKRIVEKDHLGHVVSKRTFEAKGTVAKITDGFDQPYKLKDSLATTLHYTLDDKGFDVEMRFFNGRDKPTRDEEGVYGYRYKVDAEGRTIASTAIGIDGKPMRRLSAVTTKEWTYDAHGFLHGTKFLDDAGKPIVATDGSAGEVDEIDEFGNTRSVQYVGVDGKPTAGPQGFATVKYTRDALGHRSKVELFDAAGQPTYHTEGWSTQTLAYEDGNLVDQAFLDANGKPTKGPRFARAKTKWDARSLPVEVAYFVGDAPEIVDRAYSVLKLKYDDRGNKTEESYFDATGKPVLSTWWYAMARFAYDDHDREIERSFFDAAGKPTNSRDGYAKETTKRDAAGNAIETAYFDAEGAPIAEAEGGVARIVRGFDELGNQTSEEHFDEKGNPVLEKGGFASMKQSFDESGARLTTDYFGADGTRKKQGDRAGERVTRDAMGYILTAEIIGENGEPASPIAKFTYTYDARGNRVRSEGVDKEGKPAANAEKVARYDWKYDDRGHEIEELHYDVNGKLVLAGGSAGHLSKFDVWGREIERTYLGEDGKPAKNVEGIARVRMKLDPHGKALEQAFFDENDRPTRSDSGCATTRQEFDLDGNVLHERYFDPEGKPCVSVERFAGLHIEYDARGNDAKATRTDAEGKLSKNFLISTLKFDERNFLVEQTLVNRDGKPALNVRGVHHLTWKADAHGRRIEENNFGTDGLPTLDVDGVATRRWEYDRRGNKTKESYFGRDGAPIANYDQVAFIVYVFDSADKRVRTEYHGLDGAILRETRD